MYVQQYRFSPANSRIFLHKSSQVYVILFGTQSDLEN